MKKFFVLLLSIAFLTLSSSVGAAPPTFSQVSCTGTIATIYSGGPSLSVIIQNQTPSVPAYVGPLSTITTTTAGIVLSATTGNSFIIENKSNAWYCITAGGTATIGVTVLK
jgi:hypothetical protein